MQGWPVAQVDSAARATEADKSRARARVLGAER
jgi:hypothetical protein